MRLNKNRRRWRAKYSVEVARDLLEAFAAQDRGLADFCDSSPDWPSSNTVWRWMTEADGFRAMVEVARERQLERMMYGSIQDLADCDIAQGMFPGDSSAQVAKYKAIAELRQKLATKMVPRKFCERLAVDLDGKLDGKVTVVIDGDDVEELSETGGR